MSLVLLKNLVLGESHDRARAPYQQLRDLETASGASDRSISECDEITEEKATQRLQSNDRSIYPPRIDPRIISDATIGLSDGLTVPFALTAGLSALGDTNVVIFGGLAELAAGAISMGLGGFLAGKGEAEAYMATFNATQSLVRHSPSATQVLIHSTLSELDLPTHLLNDLTLHLVSTPATTQLNFLMRFHYHLPESSYNGSRAYLSGFIIAAGYFVGGFIPLLPYLLVQTEEVRKAFWYSVVVMAIALFAFGSIKNALIGTGKGFMKGGMQMVISGGVAAAAAMGLVRAFG
ncbi:MAG: hypothetical protein M1820_007825 [Bogoriella megaspora]|nr:MAG: hypothetical protein M1820_007825 [Bogoriella megaspora]